MFKLQRIPLRIELLLNELQLFFNDYQWLHFKSILLALLVTPYKATLNGMVKVLAFGSHRSKHCEFLNDCPTILKKVLKFYSILILNLLRKSNEPIYFIIDDTTNKKQINIDCYVKRHFRRVDKKRVIKIGSKKYQIHSKKVVLKSGGAVKIVCTRGLSHCTVKTLFTTNTALPAESIITAYSKRWSIEVFFKMSKQYLGLKAYQNVNLTAIQSALRLSLISYNLLTHVFIEEKRAQGKRITEKNLAQFSVLTTRDRLRQLVMIDSMDYCLELNINKSKNKVIKEIKNMLLAA